jgi:hypothetical protein
VRHVGDETHGFLPEPFTTENFTPPSGYASRFPRHHLARKWTRLCDTQPPSSTHQQYRGSNESPAPLFLRFFGFIFGSNRQISANRSNATSTLPRTFGQDCTKLNSVATRQSLGWYLDSRKESGRAVRSVSVISPSCLSGPRINRGRQCFPTRPKNGALITPVARKPGTLRFFARNGHLQKLAASGLRPCSGKEVSPVASVCLNRPGKEGCMYLLAWIFIGVLVAWAALEGNGYGPLMDMVMLPWSR